MTEEKPILRLELNPLRPASIIDTAVVACAEIVNFHFNALRAAELTQPAESENSKFRVRGPNMSADDRRALHESWILAKAFQELLRAVRQSLEETYMFVMLLTKKHQIASSASLIEFLAPFRKRASALRFPELLDTVNNKLDTKIEFSGAYISLQVARNCLEHRAGIVSKIETHGKESFEMSIPRMKTFYLRNGEEVELEPGRTVNPGDDRAEVAILMKIETKRRPFALGTRLSFTQAEFDEVGFACHFLGHQLSSKLPKPNVEQLASSPH